MFSPSRLVVAFCCGVAFATMVGTLVPAALAREGNPSRVVFRDAPGDVWKVNVRTSHWTLVGDLPAADVRRAVVRHRARAVVIRARFQDLRRIGVQSYDVGIATRTHTFYVEVRSRPGNRAGRHALYDEPGGERIACAALNHRIDYANDRVTMRVPRSCLGRPRWVRANIGNRLLLGDRPYRRHYADNPHDDGPYSNTGTRRLYRDQV